MHQTRIVRKVPKSKPIFNLQRIYELQEAERKRHNQQFSTYQDFLQHDQENIDCALFNFTCTEEP